MQRLLRMAVIVVSLCMVTACNQSKWQEVRKGRDRSVNELPATSQFETVTIWSSDGSSFGPCFYAGARALLGTSLQEQAALDAYIDELQASGWVVDGSQSDLERVLKRGKQERIWVTTHIPWDIEKRESYVDAKNTYPTIVLIDLTFYVPERDGC
jgi:hypothetical protein